MLETCKQHREFLEMFQEMVSGYLISPTMTDGTPSYQLREEIVAFIIKVKNDLHPTLLNERDVAEIWDGWIRPNPQQTAVVDFVTRGCAAMAYMVGDNVEGLTKLCVRAMTFMASSGADYDRAFFEAVNIPETAQKLLEDNPWLCFLIMLSLANDLTIVGLATRRLGMGDKK